LTGPVVFADGGRIWVRLAPGVDRVELSVEDEGIGLDAREVETIFERYGRGDTALERGIRGHGLGLFIGACTSLDRVRLLASFMPVANAAELTTKHARAINPRFDIVVRGGSVAGLEQLRKAGAIESSSAARIRAGQEVIRHALRRFGLGGLELSTLITGPRAAYYRHMAEDEVG
jgi:hypothetical protein